MSDQLEHIYSEFSDFVTAGQTDEAKEYLIKNMEHLPQELQDEITAKLFMQAAIDAAQELETLDKLRGEAVEAGEALLAIQELLKKEVVN